MTIIEKIKARYKNKSHYKNVYDVRVGGKVVGKIQSGKILSKDIIAYQILCDFFSMFFLKPLTKIREFIKSFTSY